MALLLISKCTLLLGLAAAAFEDLRTGRIHLILILCLSVLGALLQILSWQVPYWDILLGMAVGAVLILISFLSRQSIGMGDGLMFAASGIFLGLSNNIRLLLFSLGLSSAASIILMIVLKYKGKSQIPFIPFMFAGYIFLLMF